MKGKIKNNKKLRKCNRGLTPHGVNVQYNIPAPILSNGMYNAMSAGRAQALNSAADRVSPQISGQASGVAGSVVNAIGAGIETWADPTMSQRRTSITTGPLVYEKTAEKDGVQELKNLKKENTGNAMKSMGTGAAAGAAIGSIIPGVGTVIGGAVGAIGGAISGIFGAAKRKRKMRLMIIDENRKINDKNVFKQSEAHTNLLQLAYADEYEDTQDDVLYNKGKSPFVNGKNANALVGKGETIVDGDTGEMLEVTQGKSVGTDDVHALIKPQDAIAGNLKNKMTGNTFAEDMKPLTRMEGRLKRNTDRNIRSIAANTEKLVRSYTLPLAQLILQQQAVLHSNEPTKRYNRGKVLEQIIGGVGELATLAPTLYNLSQGTRTPEYVDPALLYAPNAYASQALAKMSKRRYNIQPELELLRGLESRQRYNARLLGSEGGLNRAVDVANAISTRKAISDVYSRKSNIDNTYRGEEAQMAAQLGALQSQLQTGAMREAYDINAKNRAVLKQYKAAGLLGISQYAQMQKKTRNLRKMDDAKLRIAEKLLGLGTTQSNIDYIFGNLR